MEKHQYESFLRLRAIIDSNLLSSSVLVEGRDDCVDSYNKEELENWFLEKMVSVNKSLANNQVTNPSFLELEYVRKINNI